MEKMKQQKAIKISAIIIIIGALVLQGIFGPKHDEGENHDGPIKKIISIM